MSINILYSGMQLTREMMDIKDHNISNAGSIGFQEFDVFSEEISGVAGQYQGSKVSSKRMNTSEGPLKTTENPLDISLNGSGYFSFKQEDSRPTVYTRSGSLYIEGVNLVNHHKHKLMGFPYTSSQDVTTGSSQQPLTLPHNMKPGDTLEINPAGEITINHSDKTTTMIGTIAVSSFNNANGLHAIGDGLFSSTLQSGQAFSASAKSHGSSIHQNSLQMSNVDINQQLLSLITLQSAYNAQAKGVSGYEKSIDRIMQIQ